jgi:hydroxymethylbilane synthase
VDNTLIVGTRGSRLALAQTALVADALRRSGRTISIDVKEIVTQGDRDAKPMSEIGGQGVFTKAIEDALLRGDIDVAVHSMKDLPPKLTAGLAIAAIPQRGDPRDALVTRDGRKLAELPAGARIGTGSARRAVQLRALRPDVEPVDIRGNVDTRIRKVDGGEYDAAVLAMAGFERLGLVARVSQVFSINEMVPSPGQGALAVQVRVGDDVAWDAVEALDHRQTRIAVAYERAFLAQLGEGCSLPVGAHAFVDGAGQLIAWTMLADDEGQIHRSQDSIEVPV